MPVIIEKRNPFQQPGKYYMSLLSDMFSQQFLRKEYLKGNPNVCFVGQKKSCQTADDRAREAANLKFHPRPGSEPVVKIKMLRTADSSPDGVAVKRYEGGQVFEVGQAQGSRFVRAGWAVMVEGQLSDLEDHADPEEEKAKLKEFMNAAPKKLKVKMLETHDSSPDGVHTFKFRGGQVYELPETLARNFIRSGWAEMEKKND